MEPRSRLYVSKKNTPEQSYWNATGGSASATTGGGGILIKSGLTVVFEIIDKNGNPTEVESSLDVGVKADNDGSEILGMNDLAAVDGAVDWDPAIRSGRLYEVP